MANLIDFAKKAILSKVIGSDVDIASIEITQELIRKVFNRINKEILKSVKTYHNRFLNDPEYKKEIENGCLSKKFRELLTDPKYIPKETKFIPRPESIKKILSPDVHSRRPLAPQTKDALALSIGACGSRDFYGDTRTDFEIYKEYLNNKGTHTPLPYSTSIETELHTIFKKVSQSIVKRDRNQLNNSLLELSSNGVLDFENIMMEILPNKSIDAVSYYQLSAIPKHELTWVQRKSIIILTVLILSKSFDLKVYQIFKNQWTDYFDEDLFQIVIMSLSTLKLIYYQNSTLNQLLISDLESFSNMYTMQCEDSNVNVDRNSNIIQVTFTHLKDPNKVFELLSKESIVLFLQSLANVFNTQNALIPYIEKLHMAINDLINEHMKFFDQFVKLKAIRALRYITFKKWGKKNIMIISKRIPKDHDKSEYRRTAYEIMKETNRQENILGIPLILDQEVKKELDSIFQT